MVNRKHHYWLTIWLIAWCIVLSTLMACQHPPLSEERIQVLQNPFLSVVSKPKILAQVLDNPMSPRLMDNKLVFSQSGRGEISMMPLRGGLVKPLITGFKMDSFAGYNISAQGIAIHPRTKQLIVCAAEGSGRVFLFTPKTFPMNVGLGREIELQGATEDNPFSTILADNNSILLVSSGTKKAYRGSFRDGNLSSLEPILEVGSGITGLTVDPVSGDVFAAVYGSFPRDGSIIRWKASGDAKLAKTIASGFTNLVDVAFTPEGILLALEFGSFGSENEGIISIIATDGSGEITPFIKGLSNPSGIFVGANHKLFITEFGVPMNGQRGTAISVELSAKSTGESSKSQSAQRSLA